MKTRKLALATKTAPVAPRTVTQEVAAAEMLASRRQQLAWDLESSFKTLNEWQSKFMASPARAFEWSKEQFKVAAEHELNMSVTETLAHWESQGDEYSAPSPLALLRKLHAWLLEQALQGARYPEHSSSPTSNYMNQCRTAALASMLHTLEQAMRFRNLLAN